MRKMCFSNYEIKEIFFKKTFKLYPTPEKKITIKKLKYHFHNQFNSLKSMIECAMKNEIYT